MNKYVRAIDTVKAGGDAKRSAVAAVQTAAIKKRARRKIFRRVIIAICAAVAIGAGIFLSIVFKPASSEPRGEGQAVIYGYNG